MDGHLEFPIIRPPMQEQKQDWQGVRDLKYDKILQKSFVYLIVGKPGCGKSHLISELITRDDFYLKQFNKVIFVTPSRLPSAIYDPQDPFNSSVLTDDHIQSVIDILNQKAHNSSGRIRNYLFVLDDCVAQLRHLTKASIITNLFFNRRHIIRNANVSIIVTTQEFKSITPKLRSVVSGIFIFSPSPRDVDVMKTQYIVDKQCITKLVLIMKKYLTNEQYQFIFIQLLPKLEMFYNFLKVY